MPTRAKTGKAGTAKPGRRADAPAAPCGQAVVITEEERRALIEDVAFFRAVRHRRAEPGDCREDDRREAKRAIDAVARKRGKPG